jgi:ubiquinone/menaquinone biosynthesis C-methylase UbiE
MQRYDSIAEKYATFNEQNPMTNLDLKRDIAKIVAEKKPVLILDLACGSGRYIPFLKGNMIVGVDLSVGMLGQAKKFKNANLVRGDLFNLPFREDIFDLIISMSVIGEHCPLSNTLLKEISRILRLKGTFMFTVIPLHHRLFPYKRYTSYFLPFPIINLTLGKEDIIFSASKIEIKNKLCKLGLEIIHIRERHGITHPHFIVVSTNILKKI